ncbi:MAG: tetratricopeptide repeat protein [Desulfurella sp.]|uniref:tetratricopeptide repeat protein n=1 Tax=Desulfurella sp. TaxID=1962857 RepID=UPI003C920292
MAKKLFLLSIVVLLSSCSYNQQIKNINEKLRKIQNSTNQNTIDLTTIKPKINSIEEKLNILTQKINTLKNTTNSTKSIKTVEKTIVEVQVDNSTNNILSKIPPASLVFSNKTQNTQKQPDNEQNKNSQEMSNKNHIEKKFIALTAQASSAYQDALSTYMDRDFNSALNKFLQFLSDYPHTELEQNAYFWIGNSYYNLNNYDKALYYFSDCLNNFPKKSTSEGGKTDACLFMLYKTYKAMGNTQKAYDYLMKLKNEYPINPYFEFKGVKK